MARYIDADALEADFIKIGLIVQCSDSSRAAAYHVSKAPTVDVAPVVHGRWGRHTEYLGEPMDCSVCKAIYMDTNFNYCPSCGAKMDLE